MTPVQIVSLIVIVAFVALLVAGNMFRSQRRAPGAIRRSATPPGGSPTPPGDHRAGGDDFRSDALAVAEDPIGSQTTERSRA